VSERIPCPTIGCPGDGRYAPPGRGHMEGCSAELAVAANEGSAVERLADEMAAKRDELREAYRRHNAGRAPDRPRVRPDLRTWSDTYEVAERDLRAAIEADRAAGVDHAGVIGSVIRERDDARAEVEWLRAERDYWRGGMDRHGACRCDTNPSTTSGPEEDCPHHGRDYSYWVEGAEHLADENARLRAKVARAKDLARECQGLVGRYTRAVGENGDRVADLLSEDTYRIGTELLAALADEGDDEEFCPTCRAGLESSEHREKCGDDA
jgi:hypothetical protein